MSRAFISCVGLSMEVGCGMGDRAALGSAGWEGPPEAGDKAEGGSRELGLYTAFLCLRLGLETTPRFRQEDAQLLGDSKRQEPHKTTFF